MEDNFYNDGFEDFLQKQVKDTRMYPSDEIWRNIYKEVHGDTNWPGLTFAAFAFLSAIIFISIYFSPSPAIFESIPATKTHIATGKTTPPDHKSGELVAAAPRRNTKKLQPIPFVGDNAEDDQRTVGGQAAATLVMATEPDVAVVDLPRLTYSKPVTLASLPVSGSAIVERGKLVAMQPVDQVTVQAAVPAEYDGAQPFDFQIAEAVPAIVEPAQETIDTNFEEDYRTRSINESVNAPVLKTGGKNRLSYTVYIAGSSSYRQLLENKLIRGDGKTGPVALNKVVDVNQVVRHKPGTGIEAGVNFMYGITDKLKVTTGLQFNIRQYSMSAYMAPTEVATIGLIDGYGNVDSVGTYAVYRNSNGYLPTELVNRYYQVAIPVGLQWQVLGNRNIQLHVAASVQPTYFINRNAFLLTTDYKNYTQNPDIMRKWNLNTSLETFITYNSGEFKWQLGPQFRYQNLPTFIKEYPIREYLFDYGVKLGVSKVIK